MGNTSNAALRAWFVPRVPQIVDLLAQGTRLVEIREPLHRIELLRSKRAIKVLFDPWAS